MNEEIKKLQIVQLDILEEIKRVCEEKEIPFYLAFGSCLGALRHQGCIPWDDDIDICMHVEDFDRFVKCSDAFKEGYFLQTQETDPNFGCAIARVRLDGTILVEEGDEGLDIHNGIFVDVYPLYGIPKGKIRRKILIMKSLLHRLLLVKRPPRNHGGAAKKIGGIILKLIPEGMRKGLIKSLRKSIRKYTGSEDIGTLYGMDVSMHHIITYKKEWFKEPRLVEFEGRQMPVPTEAEKYMTNRYGDYMTLPEESKRQSYHSFVELDFGDYFKDKDKS